MAFTNEDKRRMNEYVIKLLRMKVATMATIDSFKLHELLSRLEAAEVIAADHASIYPNDEATKRWLKSKGE